MLQSKETTYVSVCIRLFTLRRDRQERVGSSARCSGLNRFLDLADHLVHVLREQVVQHATGLNGISVHWDFSCTSDSRA